MAGIHSSSPGGDILAFLTGQEEIEKALRMLEERMGEAGAEMDAMLLPLHASLPPQLQVKTTEGEVAGGLEVAGEVVSAAG